MSEPRTTDLAKWRRKCAVIRRAAKKFGLKHESVIAKGDLVNHASRGTGIVLEEWGTWISCRNCFRPIPRMKRDAGKGAATLCCGAAVFAVSGNNIFDVKFRDGKTYSINGRWLDKIEA